MRQFLPRFRYFGLAARPLFDVLSRFERATQQRVHAIGKRNKNSHFFLLNCARGDGGARSASSQQYRVPLLTVTGVRFSWSGGRALWGTQPNAFPNVADVLRGGQRQKAARRTPSPKDYSRKTTECRNPTFFCRGCPYFSRSVSVLLPTNSSLVSV